MHNRHLAGLSPKALQRIIPRLDLVVCCSRYIAGEIAEKIPPLTDKVKVIYNSVDIDQLRPRLNHLKIRKFRDIRIDPEYQKAVLYAGRLTPEKGIHCLVEAMKEVIRIHPEAVLIICGSSWFGSNVKDSYVAKLEELSQSLGKNIIFTGFVSPVEMPQVYTLADVFVGPSLCEEALGLVFLEAGAAGLPVIASRRGGIPEIVRDGINGILIDNPEDMPLLADKICYLLDNPETANTLGQQGRLFVEQNACLPIVTEKLLKLLDMVAGESL
jgi:spore coat protein SA